MSNLEDTLEWQLKAAKLIDFEREYKFMPKRKFRADFAFVANKVLVEVEGGSWVSGRHTRGSGFAKDCEKYNLAAMLGWRVLRFTGDMIESGEALKTVETMIKGEIG